MTQQIDLPATHTSFKEFLFNNRRNRIIILYLAAAAIVIQFAIFKYLYPYASYIHDDSFVYLETAYRNLDINTYMVGYSKFLRLFSVFTNSDTALVAFQYLLLQGSALFFLFTLFFFYKPGKVVQAALLCFMVLNPLFLYLANLVSSDAFFLAVSLIWFTLLLWILHKPSTILIILHALVLYIAFIVRYNALIYPFIAIGAFGLSKLPFYKKILGVAVSTLLCGLFVLYTGNKYKALTGTWQYSPFSGWQIVNNAMYAYRYVDSAERKPVPEKFKTLDNMIRTYFDTTRNVLMHPQEMIMASTVYMWDQRLTLYKYRNKFFEKDSSASELKKWSSMGPFYKAYGKYIIKQYPWHYAWYFLWPNANKYYAPPVEFLDAYNSSKDSVKPIAQVWFNYKSRKVSTRMKDFRINMLDFYPILAGVMNVVYLCSILCFILLNGFNRNILFRKCLLLVTTMWLVNAGFTILASSAALRFQSFPIILISTFALLLVDWLCKMDSVKTEIQNNKSEIENPLTADALA